MTKKRPRTDQKDSDPVHDTAKRFKMGADTWAPNLGEWLDEYAHVEVFRIGADATPFSIHTKTLHMQCSASFADQTRTLPEEDPRIFGMFAAWLYTGVIPSSSEARMKEPSYNERLVQELETKTMLHQHQEDPRCHDEDLIDLWTFGHLHDFPRLSDLALAQLCKQNELFRRSSTRGAVTKALQLPVSPNVKKLHAYLVDEAVHWIGTLHVPQDSVKYPSEYVARVLEGVMKNVVDLSLRHARVIPVTKGSLPQERCQYHCHEKGPCHISMCLMPWSFGSKEPETSGSHLRDCWHETVTVNVGTECEEGATTFVVHKRLISEASSFFNGAFHGGFLESNGNLDLPKERPSFFKLFVDWLYRRRLRPFPARIRQELTDDVLNEVTTTSMRHDQERASCADDELDTSETVVFVPKPGTYANDLVAATTNRIQTVQSDLVELYIFADRREVPALRNAIIDRLIHLRSIDNWPWLSCRIDIVQRAYSALPASSTLCAYLAEEATHCWTSNTVKVAFNKDFQSLPHAFTSRVLVKLLSRRVDVRNRRGDAKWFKSMTGFHDHADDAERLECNSGHVLSTRHAVCDPDNDAPNLEWAVM